MNKLEYEDQYLRKDGLIDGNQRSDIVKDCTHFLKTIKKLKIYIVGHEKDGTLKIKVLLLANKLKELNRQSIIVITYVECTFSANYAV